LVGGDCGVDIDVDNDGDDRSVCDIGDSGYDWSGSDGDDDNATGDMITMSVMTAMITLVGRVMTTVMAIT
jgi:hypothetical protein